MTEGFDTADLREANALLDELACVASPALAFAAILLESTLAVRPSSELKTYLDDLTRQPGRMSDCRAARGHPGSSHNGRPRCAGLVIRAPRSVAQLRHERRDLARSKARASSRRFVGSTSQN